MSTVDIEGAARAMQTQITFVTEGCFTNRRFVGPGFEMNTGEYAPCDVTIRDARPIRNHFTLDSHGFVK